MHFKNIFLEFEPGLSSEFTVSLLSELSDCKHFIIMPNNELIESDEENIKRLIFERGQLKTKIFNFLPQNFTFR